MPGKRYPAWIRFSNADADAHRSDAKGDVRGMAVKLLDVPGEKILEEDRFAPTQDFMMINDPVFLTDHAENYLKLVERINSSNPLVKLSAGLALGLKGAERALAAQSSHIANRSRPAIGRRCRTGSVTRHTSRRSSFPQCHATGWKLSFHIIQIRNSFVRR